MTKENWIELFQAIGLNEKSMTKWHQVFEMRYPSEHQAFLEWLQISAEEISVVMPWVVSNAETLGLISHYSEEQSPKSHPSDSSNF